MEEEEESAGNTYETFQVQVYTCTTLDDGIVPKRKATHPNSTTLLLLQQASLCSVYKRRRIGTTIGTRRILYSYATYEG